jgi:hypothetical protein
MVKISTLTGVWKKLIPIIMEGLQGLMSSVEKVTAFMVEIARELELEMELEQLQFHNKTDEELLLIDEQRK